MSEYLPDEGLDIILGQFPGDDLRIVKLSLCLFTSQSPSSVISGSQGLAQIVETTYTNYVRQALNAVTWPAPSAGLPTPADGRRVIYPQVTFPACGAIGASINGFYFGWDTGDGSALGVPTKCIGQANFDDLSAAVLVPSDIIKVTPYLQFGH